MKTISTGTVFDVQAQKLRIVNHNDSLESLQRVIDFPVNPVSSFEEVKKRNLINGVLLHQEYVRNALFYMKTKPIPTSEYDFLKEYFNPDEKKRFSYFQDLRNLSSIVLSKGKGSPALQKLFTAIMSEIDQKEAQEKEFSEKIYSAIEQATRMQGVISLDYYLDHELGDDEQYYPLWVRNGLSQESVFGYRKNFYGLHNELKVTMPKWLDKKIFHTLGIYNWVKKNRVEKVNKINKENFYKDLLIETVPDQVFYDIDTYLKENVLKYSSFTKKFREDDSISFKIFFSYDGNRLEISLLDFSLLNSGVKLSEIHDSIDTSVAHLVDGAEEKIEVMKQDVRNSVFQLRKKKISMYRLMNALKVKSIREFFNGHVFIDPVLTNNEYKFTDVAHLYHLPEVKALYEDAFRWRSFVNSEINKLKGMVNNIEQLIALSFQWKLPLTMPTIVEGNILSFESLYPVHLIGRRNVDGKRIEPRDLEKITNLPKLNGQLVGLTGQNAGGKTVTHETIIYSLYLAQAGLPIFGRNFVISPKEMVGMLFLDKGEGSTMQLQMRKTKYILKSVDEATSKNILLILDEVGTGTSPSAGIEYGTEVLRVVSERGVSCIFTTQFSEIAEYAEHELGGINYQLVDGHKIKKGIGKPNLSNLLKQEGLLQYFQ